MTRFTDARYGRDTHANRGMEFEAALNHIHEIYLAQGKALIAKNYVRATIIGDGKLARVDGTAIVDYSGLIRGGRFIAFDAKDNAGPSIRLDRLQPHQAEYLWKATQLGGFGFVLARFNRFECYAIPISAWAAAVTAHKYGPPALDLRTNFHPTGKASINESELPPEWAVDGYDWLKTVTNLSGGVNK